MRLKTVFNVGLLVVLAGCLSSCNNSRDYEDNSRATGWNLEGKDGGLKYKTDYEGQETGPGLVFIEGGTFTMGRVQDDVMHDWNNSPTQQHVMSFYMDETEVTNRMYLQYLDWLQRVYPQENEKYRQIYQGAVPDTLVWRNRLGYAKTMVENYLRHPAFQNYPVVGVNWVQATEFSEWRTNRVNEKILEKKGYTVKGARYEAKVGQTFDTDAYFNAPSKAYGGKDSLTRGGKRADQNIQVYNGDTLGGYYSSRKSGDLLPAYRLPTEAEWEFAALGLGGIREYNQYRGRKKYPWRGQYTRSSEQGDFGDQLANFKLGDGDYGGISGWSNDGADITNEIKSYAPNEYGLYDMAGNVAEWVADVYRPIVDDKFSDFNYYRGNVYTKNAIGEDGQTQIVQPGDIEFDTLSNGRIVAKTLSGEIKKEPVNSKDTYLRTQFSKSDNRNFRDGDKESSRYYRDRDVQGDDLKDGKRMYNSPQPTAEAGEEDGMNLEYDKSNDRTTLIDDEVRVFKGGSWKDQAYWLDPAQRRFFPQDMATDYIGFRNAMSRVGSKSKKGKRARN
jgi:gliding motility-associated lipoprotein GldJ